MADCAIEENVFTIKKAAFEGIGVIAAIDRGCSLTKILFATASSTEGSYDLHAALFDNKNFEAGVDYLAGKSIIRQSDDAKLHVTGVGCDKFRAMIEEKLGLRLQFIDEFATMTAGVRWLLKALPLEAVCHPEEDIDLSLYSQMRTNPEAEGLTKQWEVKADEEEGVFPLLFGLFGSGGGFLKLPESGPCQLVSGVGFSGKPFLGYSQMLLGTCDYEEIMRLASEGQRGNVDDQARDLLLADADSPYGRLPGSMPVFPFGKVADRQLTLEQCSRADIAHSLVAAFAANLFNVMCTSAKLTNTNRVALGGNLFRHRLMRQEIIKQQHYFAMHSLKIHFLKTGHTGAIGAMICSAGDTIATA